MTNKEETYASPSGNGSFSFTFTAPNVTKTYMVTSPSVGVYDSTFTGSISLNDTTVKDVVGKYGYTVQNISDPTCELTTFKSNSIHMILDRVTIEPSVADSRINVGETANIIETAVYDNFGLTAFSTNTIQVIFDRMNSRGGGS